MAEERVRNLERQVKLLTMGRLLWHKRLLSRGKPEKS